MERKEFFRAFVLYPDCDVVCSGVVQLRSTIFKKLAAKNDKKFPADAAGFQVHAVV
jgi:hypothetical protein